MLVEHCRGDGPADHEQSFKIWALDRIRGLLRSDPALVDLSFAEHEMRVQDVCYVLLDGLKCNSVLRSLDLDFVSERTIKDHHHPLRSPTLSLRMQV
jgi:hypothetical protein